jgi:hypothetical protein
LEELNITKDQIKDVLAESGTKLTAQQEGKLDLISVENGNPILKYNTGVSFQKKVTSNIENNRMNIEDDPSQSSVYIHTGSSHIRIPNDFRVILINDEVHFIKPGVDIYNYAEHAILK